MMHNFIPVAIGLAASGIRFGVRATIRFENWNSIREMNKAFVDLADTILESTRVLEDEEEYKQLKAARDVVARW